MVEAHKKELEKQIWNIANTLRGNMSADKFRDYILSFIFYKYLSEKMHRYADLLATGETRNIEVANMIREQYLRDWIHRRN